MTIRNKLGVEIYTYNPTRFITYSMWGVNMVSVSKTNIYISYDRIIKYDTFGIYLVIKQKNG